MSVPSVEELEQVRDLLQEIEHLMEEMHIPSVESLTETRDILQEIDEKADTWRIHQGEDFMEAVNFLAKVKKQANPQKRGPLMQPGGPSEDIRMSVSKIIRRERELKARESEKAQPIKTLKLHNIGICETGLGAFRIAFLREDPDGWRLSA